VSVSLYPFSLQKTSSGFYKLLVNPTQIRNTPTAITNFDNGFKTVLWYTSLQFIHTTEVENFFLCDNPPEPRYSVVSSVMFASLHALVHPPKKGPYQYVNEVDIPSITEQA
jgi:hypothetical protein